MGIILCLISWLVPRSLRSRWLEEWRAEIAHGRPSMALGALPDAWAMRSLRPARSRGPRLFHAFNQDVRYAVRSLLSSPGFVLGVLLSLAIGIGANVAAFSVVNAAIFRPFPGVEKQHELVRVSVGTMDPRGGFSQIADLDALRNGLTTLSGLSAHRESALAVFAQGQAAAVDGALVSSNYFEVLGVHPAAGRFFTGDEDRTPWLRPVVVISDAAWERWFTKDPAAIGTSISVNGAALQIVGVAPAHFWGVRKSEDRPDVWIPLGMAALTLRDTEGRATPMETARNA